jgi:subtilisin family serine protease
MNTPDEFDKRISKADPARRTKAPNLGPDLLSAASKASSGSWLAESFGLMGSKLKALMLGGAVSGVAGIAAIALVVTLSPASFLQVGTFLDGTFQTPGISSDRSAAGTSDGGPFSNSNEANSGSGLGSGESTDSESQNTNSASGADSSSAGLDVNTEVAPGETALQSFIADGDSASPGESNYIIVFKPAANLDREIRGIGPGQGKVGPRFQNAFKGVMARLTERQVTALSRNPNISFIEKDSQVSLVEPTNVNNQASAPWGLDRIDQTSGRDSTYTYTETGSGVTAYVIDTGIYSAHSNFGGRVLPGFSSIAGGTQDCNGHGTHVAGTIGSATYGVAKSVSLVPVRVLDCNGSGTVSGVIAGIDWVSSQAVGGLRVANMSLGGGASTAIDTAVNSLINRGVTVVVAAGNNGANACNYSPARVPGAITVASSTANDGFSSFSNSGSCVDILAPGSAIQSTWHTSTTATNVISGTSMASPHVAGTVALFFQKFGYLTPAQMDQQLKSRATTNLISGVPSGTLNSFLFTAPELAASPSPSPSPTLGSSPSPSESPIVSPSPSNPNKGGKNPRRP